MGLENNEKSPVLQVLLEYDQKRFSVEEAMALSLRLERFDLAINLSKGASVIFRRRPSYFLTDFFEKLVSHVQNETPCHDPSLCGVHENMSFVWNELGYQQFRMGRFKDAERSLRRCVTLKISSEDAQSMENREYNSQFRTHKTIGDLYMEFFKFSEAEMHYKRALQLISNVEEKSVMIVRAIIELDVKLSACLRHQGKIHDAKNLLQTVMGYCENQTDDVGDLIAKCLYELGRTLSFHNLHQNALDLLQKAFRIMSQQSKEDELGLSTIHNAIALLHTVMKRYDAATQEFSISLEIRRRCFGRHHPLVANTLRKVAVLHFYNGQYNLAKDMFTEALSILERSFGESHIEIAYVLNDLALLHSHLHEYEKTEELFTRSLEIRKTVVGESHFFVAIALSNFANFKRKLKDFDAAKQMLEEALEIDRRTFASHDYEISKKLFSLGKVCLQGQKLAEAKKYFEETLEIRKKHRESSPAQLSSTSSSSSSSSQVDPVSTSTSPVISELDASIDLALVYHYLGLVAEVGGKFKRAKHYFHHSLSINRVNLSLSEVPETVTLAVVQDLMALSRAYRSLNEFDSSDNSLRECLQLIRSSQLDRKTKSNRSKLVMKNLERLHRYWAQFLDDQNKHESAIVHYQNSLSWFEQLRPLNEEDEKTIASIQTRILDLRDVSTRNKPRSRRLSGSSSASPSDSEVTEDEKKKKQQKTTFKISEPPKTKVESKTPSDRFEEEPSTLHFYATTFLAFALAVAALALFVSRISQFFST